MGGSKRAAHGFRVFKGCGGKNVMAFFNETQTSKAKRIEVC
jgi:hypothetical protein